MSLDDLLLRDWPSAGPTLRTLDLCMTLSAIPAKGLSIDGLNGQLLKLLSISVKDLCQRNA